MILLELSISPLDKGESVGEYVARALDVIDRSGVPYRLNPMGTVMEGEWDEVMAVCRACLDALSTDCRRVSMAIKIDYREGPGGRIEEKTRTVSRHLGRDLAE